MITKNFNAKGTTCKVTFVLPAETAENNVAVLGDFNSWNPEQGTMKFVKKDKVWKATVSVNAGENYNFRYLADGATWLNDEQADAFVASPFFSENGVLAV
jgi:1,4-alpha-glucan branching enzyme